MDDLISRQAAKDAFMNATADGDKVEFCWWVLDRVPNIDPVKYGKWNVIKKRPMDEEETALSYERTINKLEKAISVERHGKWIPRIATGNIALIECSECKFHYPEVLGTFSFYYCPYCGAKMDGK